MRIATARDAANLLAPLFADALGEKLIVLHLDADRRLLGVDEHRADSEETVLLPVRDILAAALRCDSAAMVIAHNHPSGDPEPSAADVEATRRLAGAASSLDIVLEDHLVFAGGECNSFRALGLL